ncbi:transposase [Oesophagostomum dentatum]|uniref:Transposase n=1 Tax=Oesophagostomum dentatum TaxID=61180 RepID=A0A0B1T2P2_OESDE|nr:transposase [Oesophagostomum dentatum]
MYKNNMLYYDTIEMWYSGFKKGDCSLEEEERSILKYEGLGSHFGHDSTSVEAGLKSLGLVKLGRFVPHFLRQLDYDRCADACTTLLTLDRNTKWLSHLITGDEKWTFFSNLHRKAQWVGIGKQAQDVPKQDLNPKKGMVSVWWNIHGVVHLQLLDDGATVTANLCVQQLRALKAKVDESGGFVHKIYFQRDNAKPHIAREVKLEL